MENLDRTLRENIRIMAQVITEVCQRNTRHEVTDQPLSRNQFYILNILAKSGPFPISELARILDISAAAASKNMDRLEKLGYVGRSVHKTDRRSTEIKLLPPGRALIDEFDRVTDQKQRPMMENFTEEEKILLLDMLRRIVRYTLADQHRSDLICLQCGSTCGNDCAVTDLAGDCGKPQSL